MSDFKNAFELAAPKFIAVAWDFAQRSPDVTKLWVYITHEDGITVVIPFYHVGDALYDPSELDEVITGVDSSEESLSEFYHGLYDLFLEYGENTKEDDFPTRQIFAFTTADQDFNADFYWEPLQEDVPEDEQSDPFDLPYDWVSRLSETGNESAAP